MLNKGVLKMSKKILKLISIFLLLAVLFTGCSSPATQEEPQETAEEPGASTGKKILRTNNSSEPGSLDPPLA